MLKSVKTALQVFETVAAIQPVGVSEIARYLKISKSTAQRCLQALYMNGWIKMEVNASLTRWTITAKAFRIGRHLTEYGNLREVAFPVMEKLWKAAGESVHLVVAEGRNAVLLERLETQQTVRLFLPIGGWAPLHTVASGKAILAFFDKKLLDQYITHGLETLTEYTIKDPEKLRKELAQIRNRKWAIAVNELAKGASAAASPIFDRKGRTIASLAISCPTSRFPKAIRSKFISLLVKASADITRRISDVY